VFGVPKVARRGGGLLLEWPGAYLDRCNRFGFGSSPPVEVQIKFEDAPHSIPQPATSTMGLSVERDVVAAPAAVRGGCLGDRAGFPGGSGVVPEADVVSEVG